MSAPPNLPGSAPTLVTAFAGGGGVETGAAIAGIRPIASVEFDPHNPNLSKALADSNERNFRRYGHEVIRRSIQDCAGDLPPAEIFHASPVCTNFSVANPNRGEIELDREMAAATCAAINAVQPSIVTIENVPAYRNSKSWKSIRDWLWGNGYWLSEVVLNSADFGVPQKRLRFFAIGVRNSLVPDKIVPTGSSVSWWAAIADICDTLPVVPDNDILPVERAAVGDRSDFPLLVERKGYSNGTPRVLTADRPMWTIVRSIATEGGDAKDSLVIRSKFIDIIGPDGAWRRADGRCLKRWGSFPDWYEMPKSIAAIGSIVGYSVPPLMYANAIGQILTIT